MTSTRVPYMEASDVIDDFVRDHLTGHEALYDLDIEALERAAPDIIVSQALCDVCAVATGDVMVALDSLPSRPRVIDLEPETLDDVIDDCRRVGEQIGNRQSGVRLSEALKLRRSVVASRTASIPQADRPKVAFLEWLLPPFNGGHWNPEIVALAGGIDVLGAAGKPSSTLDWEQVAAAQPDVLFIACCGYDQERALEDVGKLADNPIFMDLPATRASRIYIADGNYFFSRPGPRLLDGLEIMAHALHPDVHPVSPFGSCVTIDGATMRQA